MQLKALIGKCGTVEVQTAPLLLLIGAALTANNTPDIENIIEMLDTEGDDDADA